MLISRLDKDLYNSVKAVIALVDSIAEKNHDFILDIIGGGMLQNEVEEIARHINYKRGRELILVHGYQNQMPIVILKIRKLFLVKEEV